MKTADDTSVADGQLTITCSFGFSASHELRKLPLTHKCRRNHGHNYSITASALVHDSGPGDLSSLGNYLEKTFDHRLLNDQVDFHPTSELLANHLTEWFEDNIESVVPITLVAMVVSETPTTWARCDGPTREITISKRFATSHGEVTLVLGVDGLDEFGFVTDFGDLKPFENDLHAPVSDGVCAPPAPPWSPHIAGWWLIANVKPEIHGRLVSVRVGSGPPPDHVGWGYATSSP